VPRASLSPRPDDVRRDNQGERPYCLWIEIRDLDDAADRHLVDQQFEYRLILMRLPLSGCGFDVLRERLAADVTAPTLISNRSFAEICLRPGGAGRDPAGMIGAFLVWAEQGRRRLQVGCQPLDLIPRRRKCTGRRQCLSCPPACSDCCQEPILALPQRHS
jgi:hypothetical protein